MITHERQTVFFFGYCAASHLKWQMRAMQASEEACGSHEAWAAVNKYTSKSAAIFLPDLHFPVLNQENKSANLLFTYFERCFFSDPALNACFDPRAIPAKEDINRDYIYVYASPVVENLKFLQEISRISATILKKIDLSENLIKDLCHYHMASTLQLLQYLKACGYTIIVIEGYKFASPQTDENGNLHFLDHIFDPVHKDSFDIFKKILHTSRSAVKDAIRDLGVHCIEIPSHVLDKDGFVLSQYKDARRPATDLFHLNDAFAQIMVRELLSYLESAHFQGNMASRPAAPHHSDTWMPSNPDVARLVAKDPSQGALEKYMTAHQQSYRKNIKWLRRMKAENENLKAALDDALVKSKALRAKARQLDPNVAPAPAAFPNARQKRILACLKPFIRLFAPLEYSIKFDLDPSDFFYTEKSFWGRLFVTFLSLFGPRPEKTNFRIKAVRAFLGKC